VILILNFTRPHAITYTNCQFSEQDLGSWKLYFESRACVFHPLCSFWPKLETTPSLECSLRWLYLPFYKGLNITSA